MIINLKFKLLFLLCVTFLLSYSQSGEYYLTNFTPDLDEVENENAAIIQDKNGQMQFANSRGVLKFDGRYWQLAKTPSSVFSLKLDNETGVVYAGCLDNFGFIEVDASGNDIYRQLYKSKNKFLSISSIEIIGQNIYFFGNGYLFEYSKEKRRITKQWESGLQGDFTAIFKFNDQLFVADKLKGLLKLENGKIIRGEAQLPPNEKLLFSTYLDKETCIIGTELSKLFIFNGKRFSELKLADQDYLNVSNINNVIVLNESVAVISTDKGGCVLINYKTGKTFSIVNYYSGLPDDEVYAIEKDNQSGVWIAHEYGFTRLDYSLPFRNLSLYPGLEGNLESATSHAGVQYVATSEGVYYLETVKNISELTYFFKNKTKLRKSTFRDRLKSFFKFRKPQKKINSKEEEQDSDKQKKDKKFLGLFKIKKKGKDLQPIKTKNAFIKITRKVELMPDDITFHSVKQIFKKVAGIDAKCRQLISFKEKLLVGSNKGLYEINGTKSRKISDEDILYICVSKDKKHVYLGTYSGKLLSYILEGQIWTLEYSIPLNEKINDISEWTGNKDLWLSVKNGIYRYPEALPASPLLLKLYNPYSEDVYLANLYGKMYAIIANNAFYFDEKSKDMVADTNIFKNLNSRKLIHSQNNIVWVNIEDTWKYISESKVYNKNFAYFKLFKDIKEIFLDEARAFCWIITKSNNLYHFNLKDQVSAKNASNIFLKSVIGHEGRALAMSKIEINQNSSRVSFAFVNPDYLDHRSLQYQFKLNGLKKEWSDWSFDNQVSFNYLPSGTYELLVRTKNSLNQIATSEPLIFKVKPPYWKEWWFYMCEFIFFGSLLILSVYANSTSHKFEWLSKGLTFLTIVMLIEFINTVAESYFDFKDSPVDSFLVQVFLAILILPFERVMSHFIKNAPKNSFFRMKGVKNDEPDVV